MWLEIFSFFFFFLSPATNFIRWRTWKQSIPFPRLDRSVDICGIDVSTQFPSRYNRQTTSSNMFPNPRLLIFFFSSLCVNGRQQTTNFIQYSSLSFFLLFFSFFSFLLLLISRLFSFSLLVLRRTERSSESIANADCSNTRQVQTALFCSAHRMPLTSRQFTVLRVGVLIQVRWTFVFYFTGLNLFSL